MPLLLFLLMVFVALPDTVHAAPEPYGKRFRLATGGAARVEGIAEPLVATSPTELATMTAKLLQQVEVEEQNLGPYAPVLAETFGDLSRLLERQGLFDEAQRYRERALHLVRVNEGLYSSRQGPLVRAMLDSLREREAFDELDGRYAYFFRLYGAGRPPFNDVRWAATLEYLSWQREAYLREIDRDPRRRLIDLYAEHQALLDVLVAETPINAGRLRDASLSFVQTLYLISDLEPPRDLTLSARSDQIRREDPRDFDLLRERLENLQRTLRGRGRSILTDALALTPASEGDVRAELQLALGDWFLWQGSTSSAKEAYAALWREVMGTELEDRVASWFADPVPLPQPEAFVLPLDSVGPPLTARIDVSESGRMTGFASTGREDGEVKRLRRLLRDGRFRPVYRGGVPTSVERWERRWRLGTP